MTKVTRMLGKFFDLTLKVGNSIAVFKDSNFLDEWVEQCIKARSVLSQSVHYYMKKGGYEDKIYPLNLIILLSLWDSKKVSRVATAPYNVYFFSHVCFQLFSFCFPSDFCLFLCRSPFKNHSHIQDSRWEGIHQNRDCTKNSRDWYLH